MAHPTGYPLAVLQQRQRRGVGSKALPPKSSLTFALARTPRRIAYGSLFRRALCPCAHATTPPGRQAARPSSYRGLKRASGRLGGARCPPTSPLWPHARRQWLAGDHESTGPLGLFVAKSKEQRRWQVRWCWRRAWRGAVRCGAARPGRTTLAVVPSRWGGLRAGLRFRKLDRWTIGSPRRRPQGSTPPRQGPASSFLRHHPFGGAGRVSARLAPAICSAQLSCEPIAADPAAAASREAGTSEK